MKKRTVLLLSWSLLTFWFGITPAWSQSNVYSQSTFNFTGRLYESNAPANNLVDFLVRLFDSRTNGKQVGPLVAVPGTSVTNGYFNVLLNFGSNVFNGSERWLDVQYATNQSQPGTPFYPLSDRVPILPTPYATYAFSAGTASVASSVTPGAVTAVALAPGSVGTVAIADGSITPSDLSPGLLGDTFWRLLGNENTNPKTNFLGTIDDTALTIGVHSLPALRILPNLQGPSLVGGFQGNVIVGGSSVIAGGGIALRPNTILADWSAIVGGISNLITSRDSIIGGGFANLIVESGGTNFSHASFIGGGSENLITNGYVGVIGGGSANKVIGVSQGTIGGGGFNVVAGELGTVGGGGNNRADQEAVVGGGFQNIALGRDSTIAGGTFNHNSAAYASIGGGFGNGTAARASVIAGGQFNQIGVTNDFAAILGGNSNTNLGSTSTISGGEKNTTLGAWSVIPGGLQAIARSHGQLAFASGQLDTPGDAQVSTFVLRRKLKGNVELFLDGNGGLERIFVPDGAVWTLRFQISAVSVTGANFASYEVSGMIANVGGAVSFHLMDGSGATVGTARAIFETPGAVPWQATPYNTGTAGDNTLRIAVFASEEVKWCARIDATEVTR